MIALGWLYWLLYQLTSLVLTVLGWPLIAVLAALRLWTDKAVYWDFKRRIVWAWRGGWLTYVWSNDEDGICPNQVITPWRAWLWSAWRNPANNLRFALPGAYYVIQPSEKVSVRLLAAGYVVTCGWRQCVTWNNFRFGWLMDDSAAPGYRVWPTLERV